MEVESYDDKYEDFVDKDNFDEDDLDQMLDKDEDEINL